MDEIKKLEMDLGSLISQAERDNASFSHQLAIRQRIQEATSQLAQNNAYAIQLLIEHTRAMTRHSQATRIQGDEAFSISEQLAAQMSHLQ